MKNDIYYEFPENGCTHDKYSESKCEWEKHGKQKYNTIRECAKCGDLSETNVKIVNA